MIIIAGFGFVGKAYYNTLKRSTDVIAVDPKFNDTKIKDISTLNGLIVCVPTPQDDDGSCYMGHVYDVIADTPLHVPVMIKSTISLDGWKELESRFPEHAITFSPEFLRAATAEEDVLNTTHSFIAGGNTDYWRDVYSIAFPDIKISICNPEDAIAIKYFRNSFLATKCSFFNEIFIFCEQMGLNYDTVRYGVSVDKRIGESHTFIEPHSRGWGGYCFPKDTAALLKMAANNNINLNTLEAAVNSNKNIRNNT